MLLGGMAMVGGLKGLKGISPDNLTKPQYHHLRRNQIDSPLPKMILSNKCPHIAF